MHYMDEHIATQIGRQIKQARAEAELSLRDLGKLISSSHIAISKWERGIVKVDVESLFSVARALQKPLSYFLADLEEELLQAKSLDTSILQMERDITDPLDNEIQAMLFLQYAVKLRYAGRPQEATIYASRSKALWESLGEPANAASALVALGDIAGRAQNDWDAAEEHYRQAVDIMESLAPHKSSANTRRHAQALWALSRVPARKSQYQEALDLLARAREMNGSDAFGLAVIGRLIGFIHLDQGAVDRAAQVLNEALIHARKASHPHGEAQILVALARAALGSNDENGAKRYLRDAQSLAHQEEFQNVLDEIKSIRDQHRLE
ncbi:MAG: helix-turn-helix transcriptional regulator [Chloroflexi bacterium]|nr:helix-turn-helix transcriptional regulator [Chloroflexota bacterium]